MDKSTFDTEYRYLVHRNLMNCSLQIRLFVQRWISWTSLSF